MMYGKVCEKHPELNGKRYDTYKCCGCSALYVKRYRDKDIARYKERCQRQPQRRYYAANKDAIKMYIQLKRFAKRDGLWD
jgi:hypothetical protein